jgi:hypothetical protein
MRTLLICHDDAALDREGLVRWMGSYSTYVGTVVIREPPARLRRRIAREIRRIGWLRFIDVLAFRAYHALARARGDREWSTRALTRLRTSFPAPPDGPEIVVSSPNDADTERFIREQRPELIVARCKSLLKEEIFSIPRLGTFVMHPGICPEYRNAHGCFWAIANGDHENVGMTLLRIDRGVDTGPVFGYFRLKPEPKPESHVIVEHRVVLDHLDAIRDVLLDIEAGRAVPIDTSGRRSAAWGQPWLSAHLRTPMRHHRAPKGRETRTDTHASKAYSPGAP